jgi:ParB-like chromosome segregation protein Spo0J
MSETELAAYQVHPAATIFPLLPDDEMQELVDDIRTNGLQHPIVRNGAGVIIDGRNRLLACCGLGLSRPSPPCRRALIPLPSSSAPTLPAAT